MSKSQEWYTPPCLLAMVRELFGGSIDLDPCANSLNTTEAAQVFTAEDDGLSKPWNARNVFINAPWNDLYNWVSYALSEHQNRGFYEAIILVPARTETKWFQLMAHLPMCLPNSRVKYLEPTEEGLKKRKGGLEPSCLFYIGPHKARFAEIFSRNDWGRIYQCVS